MLSSRVQLRIAICLQDAYESAMQLQSCTGADCERLTDYVRELRAIVRRIDRAHRHDLELAAASLRIACQAELDSIACVASRLSNGLVLRRIVPTLRDLMEELSHLQSEFDDVRVHWDSGAVIAVTDPIELEGIDLGCFAIEFHWDRLSASSERRCFAIVAQEPNTAAGTESVTHPHVRDDFLCPGDAAEALDQAVEHGRLADAFLIVRSVLMHYNARSAYVRLSDWGGMACGDCGYSFPEEDACTCAECGASRCEDCISSCSICGDSSCTDCLKSCISCGDHGCCQCVTAIGDGEETICTACVRECPACGEKVARDQLDADTGLCPGCLPAEAEPNHGPTNANPEPMEDSNANVSTAPAEAGVFSEGLAEVAVSVSPGTN